MALLMRLTGVPKVVGQLDAHARKSAQLDAVHLPRLDAPVFACGQKNVRIEQIESNSLHGRVMGPPLSAVHSVSVSETS